MTRVNYYWIRYYCFVVTQLSRGKMMTVGTSLKQLFQLCSGKYLKSEPSKFKAVNKVCLCWLCQADLTEKRGVGEGKAQSITDAQEQSRPRNQPRPPCSVDFGRKGWREGPWACSQHLAPWLQVVSASSQAGKGKGCLPWFLSSYVTPISQCALLFWTELGELVCMHSYK